MTRMELARKQPNRDVEIFREFLKAIPVRRTKQQKLRHEALLSDGTRLVLSMHCCNPETELPSGASDRKLFTWLWRRALRTRELDMSWAALLEYLGPGSTAIQQQALMKAVERIASTAGSYSTRGNALTLFAVGARLMSWLPQCVEDDETMNFGGEICFEFHPDFMELARRAKGKKQISFLPSPAALFENISPPNRMGVRMRTGSSPRNTARA